MYVYVGRIVHWLVGTRKTQTRMFNPAVLVRLPSL